MVGADKLCANSDFLRAIDLAEIGFKMTTDANATQAKRLRRRPLMVAMVCVLVAAVAVWWRSGQGEQRASELLQQARLLRLTGDDEGAGKLAATAFKLNSKLGDAAYLAGECAEASQKFDRAVAWFEQVPSDDPGLQADALFRAAEICFEKTGELSRAEQFYRAVIELGSKRVAAITQLARLLALSGRSREVEEFVLRLISLDQPTDLVVLLSRDQMGLNEPELLARARRNHPHDLNALLGAAWSASLENRHDEAIGLVRELLHKYPQNVAGLGLLGRELWEAERVSEVREWARSLTAEADSSAEVWRVRGDLAERDGDMLGAVRCFGEALKSSPESLAIAMRLQRALQRAGEGELAAEFERHLQRMQHVELAQQRVLHGPSESRTQDVVQLAIALSDVGRMYEAYGWCLLARQRSPENQTIHLREHLLQDAVLKLPLVRTASEFNFAAKVDWSRFQWNRDSEAKVTASVVAQEPVGALSLREEARSVGLRFRYMNGVDGKPTRRMFEFTGGGVGVIDFELDGFPDAYFTQGARWPVDDAQTEFLDRLFRNRDGAQFDDVTDFCGIIESRFGQGVSVGDFNSDGFPDLYVANIGGNRLYRNLGDGRFEDVTDSAEVSRRGWTTSCVMADLGGDGLPDLYDVNYVTSSNVYDRVCWHSDGSEVLCAPFDFDPLPDRFWLNDGAGRFVDATQAAFEGTPEGKGLGALAWSPDESGRLSLLVTNDTTPNFLFVPKEEPNEHLAGLRFKLIERGVASGVAFNADGKATGSMGIALGDADDDGRLDLLITNFLAEPNTLFLHRLAGLFEDRTKELKLSAPSIPQLGFGTQFIDLDSDGVLELFVANGHVDDLRRFGKPYRMPAQVFRRRRGAIEFEEVPGSKLGSYFEQQWLGRAVARWDWNRDGREDLVVGHLHDDSALLTNTTENGGHYLSLKLFGVSSNRDAVGAIVRVVVRDRTLVRQVTAGDGYQASNERRLVIGVGEAKQVRSLIVRWPSGLQQQFDDVSCDQDFGLIEGGALQSLPGKQLGQ